MVTVLTCRVNSDACLAKMLEYALNAALNERHLEPAYDVNTLQKWQCFGSLVDLCNLGWGELPGLMQPPQVQKHGVAYGPPLKLQLLEIHPPTFHISAAHLCGENLPSCGKRRTAGAASLCPVLDIHESTDLAPHSCWQVHDLYIAVAKVYWQ